METKLLNGVFDRMPIHQKLDPEMLTLFGITKSPADLAAAEINNDNNNGDNSNNDNNKGDNNDDNGDNSNNIDSVRQLDVKMDKGCSINGNNEEKANAATVNGTQTPRMSAICIRPCFGQFDLIM